MEYSQSALVNGIKNKDIATYEYIVNKYTRMAYYIAYNILSSAFTKEDIEECVSDVFIEAWMKVGEFDPEKGNFRTWILMLTKYKALTYKRKKRITNIVDIEEFEFNENSNISASKSAEGVNMGTKIIEDGEKLKLQVIAAFDDKEMKLVKYGKLTESKVTCVTENISKDNIISSSSPLKTEDLNVYDAANNAYKLEIPQDAKERPITIFETNAPKGEPLTLKVPSLLVMYPKQIDKLQLSIPQNGEAAINKELDFNIQKAVIKNIKRVSPTSAVLEIDLNTKGSKAIDINSFDIYSADVKKINTEFEGDKAIVTLEFNEGINATELIIEYPMFVINGDWAVDVK